MSARNSLLLGLTRRFKKEPDALFGLVDPVLDKTRGGNIFLFVAELVQLAHEFDERLIVATQFVEHGAYFWEICNSDLHEAR